VGALDLLTQDGLVEEVLHPDADAADLVGVGRADAATGRPDLTLAEEALLHLVEGAVRLRDDVGVGRDLQLRGVDAARFEGLDLLEEHLEVHDHAVADDGRDARREDPGRQQVQGVLLIADDDGVTRVVAAVELHDPLGAFAEQVRGLAFTLVAPLDADDHDSGHALSP
jgi:hypothetical protein